MLSIQTVRVAGIPGRIDASWLLVFALIAWSLDDGPGKSRGVRGVLVVLTLVAALLAGAGAPS